MRDGNATTVGFDLRANLVTLDVLLNGESVDFVLDTGASVTVIDEATAGRIGLREVQKQVGCGAGGEVEMSMARVGSLAVGHARADNFTAMVMGLDGIKQRVGSEISGVLGFDFLSRFKITIDYRDHTLTLEPYAESGNEAAEPFFIEEDRFVSEVEGIAVTRPTRRWSFETDTRLPDTLLILRDAGSDAEVTVQRRILHGIELGQIVPSIERSLAVQLEDLRILTSEDERIASTRAHLLEYTARTDGEPRRFKHAVLKIDERLFSIVCKAPTVAFAELEPEFDRLLQTLSVYRPVSSA